MQINTSVITGTSITESLIARPLLGRVRTSAAEQAACEPVMRALAEQVKDKTGIVFEHLVPFQRYASENNCVIGVRAVDQLATGLIAEGHPTKNFLIKGKSASWGPQAGLICTDQHFSKLEGQSTGTIEKYNKQVAQCLKDGHANSGPLILNLERLKAIQTCFARRDAEAMPALKLTEPSANGDIHILARSPSGSTYAFVGVPVEQGDQLAYRIEHEGRPLEVLRAGSLDVGALPSELEPCHLPPPSNERPLTADYDLLVIGPHLSQLDKRDNLPVPDVSQKIFLQRFEHYGRSAQENLMRETGTSDFHSPAQFYRAADPLVGNTSQRIKQMIPEINEALVGQAGQWLVHHGADTESPVSDPAANYPATFFLPERVGRFDEICVIEDNQELAELIRQAKDAGYHMPINPLWDEEPGLVHSELQRSSFVEEHTRQLLSQRFCVA